MVGHIRGSLQYDKIRTLEVRRAKDHVLDANSLVEKLDQASFVAVSYVWGDASNVRIIRLDGASCPVGNKAFGILDTFASPNRIQDETERTAQVLMMQDIYARAQSTVTFLGSPVDPEVGERAMSWLASLVDFGSLESFRRYEHQVHSFWDDTAW
ncbi:hypothetical protein B0A55_11293 [Friedmanniomyces simplex]|uniref:Heterokaryon incompatibility domain-containing protein n=1 Tax=Friedmanniomyces simplex TaxID=329884 RepID=A0A4V6WKT6_9PEZI|nr:hypothetical protein B0A55_11293 [Friedmanniomyces simplex]